MWRLSVARASDVERSSSLPDSSSDKPCCNDGLLGDEDGLMLMDADDAEQQRLIDLRDAFWARA